MLSVGILQILLSLALQALPQGSSRPTQLQVTRNPHGPISTPCENCHTSTSWKPIRAIPEFDHDKTRYPLRGMHEKVQCTQCHTKLVFTNVGSRCADCHADIHRRQMGANCEQCHTVNGWNVSVQAIQNHFNRFPLLGAHAALQCDDCHKGAATGQFQGLSTACYSCHAKDFQSTATLGGGVPNHVAAGFSPSCEQCHGMNTWANVNFSSLNHAGPPINFPLTNAHASVACTSCHVNNNYNLTGIGPTDCGNSGCHLTTWQQTTNPAHAAVPTFFPIAQCSACHTTAGWAGASFPHSVTGFPLTSGHASVPCASCHVSNNYNLTTPLNSCGDSGCHLTTWQQTTNPVHSSGGPQFAVTNCAGCHTTAGWTTTSFDHSASGFPLVGTHLSTPCASCHISNNYTLSSTDCYGCHQAAFMSTANLGGSVPNHVAAGFPTTAAQCASCHSITTWAQGVFNHASTGFPLTGFHATSAVTCASCHLNNNYSLTVTTCVSCHLAVYQATTAPNHVQSGFPQTCEACHTTSAWTGAVFNHASTGFALTGAHISPPALCTSCHVNNNYTLSSAACFGCHLDRWQSTATLGGAVPNHITAAFPTDCSLCHSTSAWTGAVFNHAATGFPLTGFHATSVPCAGCHINNNYTLTSGACINCHAAAYQSTTTLGGAVPNHVAAAFPTDCTLCHTTTAWTGAVFNHNATAFPLTGFHATSVPCASCHVNNNYTTLPTACYGCHAAVYNSTTNPAHAAAGFPTTCATCHTTTAWTGATFSHPFFPLTHGRNAANGVCSVCHTNAANYAVFQCTQCHGGGVAANFHHPGVGGYAYNSVNCYQCHPNAR